MNSYNDIRKIKYETNNENEPVSLNEYIVFKDDRNEQKYAILKFRNNITQRLFKFSFSVSQFNANGDLLEKNEVNYSSVVINENETFVPQAKLKLNFDTETIAVETTFAKFETMEYKNGQFEHVQYTFDEYVKNEVKQAPVKKEEAAKKIKKTAKKEARILSKLDKQENKKIKKGYFFEDITKNNKTKGPFVLTCIATLCLSIFAFLSMLNIKDYATWFTYGDFDYSFLYGPNSTTLEVLHYNGNEKDVVVPVEFSGYRVVGICDGAFSENKNLESVNISGKSTYPVKVYEHAFYNCDNLISVTSSVRLDVVGYAFESCDNLTKFDCINATLNPNVFYKCASLRDIYYYDISVPFYEVFDRDDAKKVPFALKNIYYKQCAYPEFTFQELDQSRINISKYYA